MDRSERHTCTEAASHTEETVGAQKERGKMVSTVKGHVRKYSSYRQLSLQALQFVEAEHVTADR